MVLPSNNCAMNSSIALCLFELLSAFQRCVLAAKSEREGCSLIDNYSDDGNNRTPRVVVALFSHRYYFFVVSNLNTTMAFNKPT